MECFTKQSLRKHGSCVLCRGLQVGDECLIAPLALFRPEMLGVTGPKQARVQSRNPGDPQDPHDDNYLIQTQASEAPSLPLQTFSGLAVRENP